MGSVGWAPLEDGHTSLKRLLLHFFFLGGDVTLSEVATGDVSKKKLELERMNFVIN